MPVEQIHRSGSTNGGGVAENTGSLPVTGSGPKKGPAGAEQDLSRRVSPPSAGRAIEVEMDNGAVVSRVEAESTMLKELLEH